MWLGSGATRGGIEHAFAEDFQIRLQTYQQMVGPAPVLPSLGSEQRRGAIVNISPVVGLGNLKTEWVLPRDGCVADAAIGELWE